MAIRGRANAGSIVHEPPAFLAFLNRRSTRIRLDRYELVQELEYLVSMIEAAYRSAGFGMVMEIKNTFKNQISETKSEKGTLLFHNFEKFHFYEINARI